MNILPHQNGKLAMALADELSRSGLLIAGMARLADPLMLPKGSTANSVILIGHAGSSIWPHFSKWLASQNPVLENPLDAWSKEVINAAAAKTGGHAVFPSNVPFLPFQQWAMQAQGLRPSPLGILIHPVHGLWHAFRGAVLFEDLPLSQPLQKLSHPCDSCVEKPCLSACPVDAFSENGFAVDRCRSHLATAEGDPCMSGGCLARRACPVGQVYAYEPAQMRFHMEAFRK